MKLEQRQQIIAEIKATIDAELGTNCTFDRDRTLIKANIPKRSVKGVEVICDSKGALLLSVAIMGEGSDELAPIVKDILTEEGYVNLTPNQKNPRYEYSLERFKFVYNLLTNHDALEDAIGGRLTPRLFKKEYSPAKILGRYLFAFKRQDQDMLDGARDLLGADNYDKDIALNEKSKIRDYREHVVPCIHLHCEIINRIQEEIKEAQKVDLPNLIHPQAMRELENLIQDNLKIAYIATKDAEFLDHEMKLRTTMPEGWEWGDSVTARLDENNIKY